MTDAPKLKIATYSKVEDIQPQTSGHNMVLKVIENTLISERKQVDRSVSRVAEVVLADETGCITMTAKNEQIEQLKVGTYVVIRNAGTVIFHDNIRLQVTQWGKISQHPDGIESTPNAPKTINTSNDVSAVEYELVQ